MDARTLRNPAAALVLAAIALPAAAQAPVPAQSFVLEGAVIDSRTAASLGVTSERGDIASLFRAQKTLTFGILRSAGIDLDTLPPEVRARIERFQTTNLEAFRAFSNGLDLKDQGRFAEAREQFRRAAELDPGFGLAVEQQQAMPEINLGTSVQIRAVVAAAAGQAVDRGKASFAIDAAQAVAAIQAGQAVVQGPAAGTDATILSRDVANEFSVNAAGSGVQYVPNLTVGLAFDAALVGIGRVGLALAGEWEGLDYRVAEDGALLSVGAAGEFRALRGTAAPVATGSTALGDGSVAYWGRWISAPGASASVVSDGIVYQAPALGTVDWVTGDATRVMPTTGTAVFTPAGGGNMSNVSGSVAVNFVTRGVNVVNLGFTLDGLVFSGLMGAASYDAAEVARGFTGTFSAGTCGNCTILENGGSFGGNFIGAAANGLVLTTVMNTDAGVHGGVTLMKRP